MKGVYVYYYSIVILSPFVGRIEREDWVHFINDYGYLPIHVYAHAFIKDEVAKSNINEEEW